MPQDPGIGPLPYRTRQQVRQQMIASVTQLHGAGPSPDGDIHVDLDFGDVVWTSLELTEAFGFVIGMYLRLAFEVGAANAEGRSVDVSAHLRNEALDIALNPAVGPFTGTYEPGTDPGIELPE